jgi:plasmid stabilization system protein ParE
MKLPVAVSRQAEDDIQRAYDWWAEHRSAAQAARWYDGLTAMLGRLGSTSHQSPHAAESERTAIDVREALFGLGRRPSHRVLFTIRPDSVYVLGVRHVSQDDVPPDDLF